MNSVIIQPFTTFQGELQDIIDLFKFNENEILIKISEGKWLSG